MKKMLLVVTTALFLGLPVLAESGPRAFWEDYKTGFNPIIRNDQGKVDKTLTALTVSLVSLNAMDFAGTHYGISQGAHEANPLMSPLVNHEPLGAIYKFGLIHPIFVLTAKQLSGVHGKARVGACLLIGAEVAFYAWVNAHNLRIIRQR